MTTFKTPEIAARFGSLDDEAFVSGEPVSAHVLREMVRQGNYLASRGGFMLRWLGRNTTVTEQGRAISFAPPFWRHMLNSPVFPVSKPYGITSIRVRMRLIVSSGQLVQLFVGTHLKPSPHGANLSDFTTVTGTGAMQVIDFNVPCRVAPDEQLSFYVRALTDAATDPLMVTATYGSPNTGVVDRVQNTVDLFTRTGSTWNVAGNTVDIGGHYVTFSNAAGGTPRHGPAEIRGVLSATQLTFYPAAPDVRLIHGATFTLRKLPNFQVISVAAYGIDRSV